MSEEIEKTEENEEIPANPTEETGDKDPNEIELPENTEPEEQAPEPAPVEAVKFTSGPAKYRRRFPEEKEPEDEVGAEPVE